MRALQLLIALLMGWFCVFIGIKNPILIAIYMFLAAYGLTVWLPETMEKFHRWLASQ